MPAILVTGAAGFVDAAGSRRLLDCGESVIGVDNFNNYYDVSLKEARAAPPAGSKDFELIRTDISDADRMQVLVDGRGVKRVIHLADQGGVRYSLESPFAYERSDLAGRLSILEVARTTPIRKIVPATPRCCELGSRKTTRFQ